MRRWATRTLALGLLVAMSAGCEIIVKFDRDRVREGGVTFEGGADDDE